MQSDDFDSRNTGVRNLLRLVGPAMMLTGLVFLIIGLVSFFSAFGGGGPPQQFWCAFVGIPLLGIGIGISQFAYVRAITRYMAGEVAPVGKDVANYMVEGTKQSAQDMAAAVGEGLREGVIAADHHLVHCSFCNTDNEATAIRCSACGAALVQHKKCTGCGKVNEPEARFCNQCGAAL